MLEPLDGQLSDSSCSLGGDKMAACCSKKTNACLVAPVSG